MRFSGLFFACALATPVFADDVSASGFVCRQATDFLEFCGETQADDYRGWRFADLESSVWWYPPASGEIVARIEAIPATPPLKAEEARDRALAEPFYDIVMGEQIEIYADWVNGWEAETIVHAVEERGKPWIHTVTWFELNQTLIRIETVLPDPVLSPQYRQAHAAFLWAIRFKRKGE